MPRPRSVLAIAMGCEAARARELVDAHPLEVNADVRGVSFYAPVAGR